ncbi:cuticle protein 7-like [Halyomorpha halys]|uniref:cuticle protein 7-like n=1 Tax=Halyomorpha halys TaxID=286706 RepID=UPI0006D4DD3B|nr:cuticle protein 7-like [Halyomorpha halys]KAE8573777.1 Cuticle Protein CPR RR-2 [Halyomorpha halys]
MIRFVVLALAISAVHCQYGGYNKEQAPEYKEQDYYAPAHYNFDYSVKDEHTGDIKSQREQREGDKTEGEYSLVEPDGTLRVVKYYVDGKSGFVAEVHREPGKYQPAPEPAYKKQEPSYYKPQPSYQKAEPSYYKPQPSYQKAEPSYYKPQPSYNKPEPSYYKPQPKYY